MNIIENRKKINEIVEALNAEKANDPQELCGHILQHTIAGEIKCAEKRPCKFHDVPEKAERCPEGQMNECCKYFFDANRLQNILNSPLRCCGYCGRRLTDKEFARVLKKDIEIGKLSTSGVSEEELIRKLKGEILMDSCPAYTSNDYEYQSGVTDEKYRIVNVDRVSKKLAHAIMQHIDNGK